MRGASGIVTCDGCPHRTCQYFAVAVPATASAMAPVTATALVAMVPTSGPDC
jgi:hypothetical protein